MPFRFSWPSSRTEEEQWILGVSLSRPEQPGSQSMDQLGGFELPDLRITWNTQLAQRGRLVPTHKLRDGQCSVLTAEVHSRLLGTAEEHKAQPKWTRPCCGVGVRKAACLKSKTHPTAWIRSSLPLSPATAALTPDHEPSRGNRVKKAETTLTFLSHLRFIER